MINKEEKRLSVFRIIAISVGIVLLICTILVVLYKLFKKYFRVTFDCGDCDSCSQDCFSDDFDPLYDSDDDFTPECNICDDDAADDDADDSEEDPFNENAESTTDEK